MVYYAFPVSCNIKSSYHTSITFTIMHIQFMTLFLMYSIRVPFIMLSSPQTSIFQNNCQNVQKQGCV